MVDMRHKLVTFIVKNPPPVSSGTKTGRKAAAAQEEKLKKTKSNDSVNASDDEEDNASDEDHDALTRRIQAEAAELKDGGSGKLDDWTEATETEAYGGLSADMARKLNLVDDDAEDGDGAHYF